MTGNRQRIPLLKELLLALCLAFALPTIVRRIAGIDGAANMVAFAGLLCVMWFALIAAAYIRSARLRWPIALVLTVSAYYFQVFERVTTQFMTYDAFINMMHSAAFASDAFAQNRSAFFAAVPFSALLLAALAIAPRRQFLRLPSWLVPALPLLGTVVLASVLFLRGGEGARGLPPSFTPAAYLVLAGYEGVTGELGPREPVSLQIAREPLSQSIVLIVDESVSGQYLDINSPNGVKTPLSGDPSGVSIHNFGLAASITNCSVGTNVTLRHGGTRKDYRRINATMPSVWAFARKAGLQTVYIDAQRNNGALHNLMDEQELAEIDRHIQFDDVPVQQRDIAVARELVDQLADPAPKFILVNKVGAHFPVHDKFPDAYFRYRPALPRGRYADITDTGSRDGFDGSLESWRRYRNSYRNTLLWNVGVFFEELLDNADLSRATVIYTADHGQNLHERGDPGLFTHCSPYPHQEEGVVPLVVIDGADGSGIDWAAFAQESRDRSSHYRIFPTLLTLMGFDGEAVSQVYGEPLQSAAPDPASFNTLFNARLNRKPNWMKLDPETIVQPPAADYR